MDEYSKTMNLPKTEFPMKANLAVNELKIYNFWNKINLYTKIRIKRNNIKYNKFELHDGPPYANGDIHIGHALNKILKDIVNKSKLMEGFNIKYVPGWDCHGLPIELNVEKKAGRSGDKITHTEFRKLCRKHAISQVEKQKKDFSRLGVIADWNKPYLTMDYKYEANIVRCLWKMVSSGYVYLGNKPVYWCFNCRSALAEAEVKYINKKSESIYIKFYVSDEDIKDIFLNCFNTNESVKKPKVFFIVWTTTPWTLPSNKAIAVNSKLMYLLISSGENEYFIVAEDLLDNVIKSCNIKNYQIISKCYGKKFCNIITKHPFYNRCSKIVLSNHVLSDSGSGIVHIAPDHGHDDYIIGLKNNLGFCDYIDEKGVFREEVKLFSGMYSLNSNNEVINVLKSKNNLLSSSTIEHSYPHCWRHNTPLIYKATAQWFIRIDHNNLRDVVIDEIKKVKWNPKQGKKIITDMIKKRPDWCISRQRSWGVPIAVFLNKNTNKIFDNSNNLLEDIVKKIEISGIDTWDYIDNKYLDNFIKNTIDYKKVTDILDVWFDSGVSHSYINLEEENKFKQFDLYFEGTDQYRGWFNSSLITSCILYNKAPYKEVLTHGFVVDEFGKKMSKSTGNVIDPNKIVNTLGADILRLWVSSVNFYSEVSISKEILDRIVDSYRKIRNTCRYLLSNLYDFIPSKHMSKKSEMLVIDRWIIGKLFLLQKDIISDYKKFQFNSIFKKIMNFCTYELSSFYLDIIKDRLYTCRAESLERRSSQTAMFHIIESISRIISPIISYTAEEIRQFIPGKNKNESIFEDTWYTGLSPFTDKTLNNKFWENILYMKNEINKRIEVLRKDGVVGSSLETDIIFYLGEEDFCKKIVLIGNELKFAFLVSNIDFKSNLEIKNNSSKSNFLNIDVCGAIIKIEINKSDYNKCSRCWHRIASVGLNKEHSKLCCRCISNLFETGENRKYI